MDVVVLSMPGVMPEIYHSYSRVMLDVMPELNRQACKYKAGQQVSNGRQHICHNKHDMAGGGLLVDIVMHLLHQIIGDDHDLLL